MLLPPVDDSLDNVPTEPDCLRVNFARNFALRSGIEDATIAGRPHRHVSNGSVSVRWLPLLLILPVNL
jgi:hypothetical protein